MDGMEKIAEFLQSRITHTSTTTLYACEICHDNGWIESKDENGYRFVQKCACQKARDAERLLKASGLSDVIEQQTFDTFRTDTVMQKRIKALAESYLKAVIDSKNSTNKKPWLYIGGNPGSGKTHICTAVCGGLLKNNIGVRYMQWLTDARKLKALVNDPDFDDDVQEYIQVSVLYIDDLLKQKYTEIPVFSDADIKIAFKILNDRYLLNKPTIISTEWDLIDQLLPADEGLFSRVYERSKGFTLNVSRNAENNFRMNGVAG